MKSTDSRGIIIVTIKIKKGNPGLYVINFGSDAAYSEAIMLQTTFPPSKITIESQPYTKNDTTATPYAGNYIVAPKIKILDANDKPLENYKVVAIIDRNSSDSNGDKAMLDLTDFIGLNDPFVVLTEQKTARTDSDGIATLSRLSVLDVDSSKSLVCIKYIFVVGQAEMNIKSVSSSRVCFKSTFHASLSTTNYSRIISQNSEFAEAL